MTDISYITGVSVKVIRPDSRIPMLFSFFSRITLVNHCKSRFPQLSIIPNPARYFYKHPISRYQNNRDPASRKTYWGPSTSMCSDLPRSRCVEKLLLHQLRLCLLQKAVFVFCQLQFCLLPG